jgi:small conductance mechanosensitive channel
MRTRLLNPLHLPPALSGAGPAFAQLRQFALIVVALASVLPCAAAGQIGPDPSGAPAADTTAAEPSRAIDVTVLTEDSDEAMTFGLRDIFTQIDGLDQVSIAVRSGVVTLSGTTRNQADRQKAEAIAGRVAGVVAVENAIDRNFEVDSNVSPILASIRDDLQNLLRGLPLLGVAFLLAIAIGSLGYLLAGWRRLWLWVAPNAFLANLISGAIRVVAVVAGVILGLQVLDATALLGLVLGGAGIIGIALGFAIRDTVDNYVSSLMLSLRQPFRANDHVIIDDHEGRVIRLTSRATILMTLDGNHLRIPNAAVFKANILNFTRNPQRRFQFDLGVDSAADPLDAMREGLASLKALSFVLADPPSHAIIDKVGDSTIDLRFFGWLDQRRTDFGKGRSLAIDAAKRALENAGFELPEPIYRVRMDARTSNGHVAPEDRAERQGQRASRTSPPSPTPEHDAAAPDLAVERLVSEERGEVGHTDLLDASKPTE